MHHKKAQFIYGFDVVVNKCLCFKSNQIRKEKWTNISYQEYKIRKKSIFKSVISLIIIEYDLKLL